MKRLITIFSLGSVLALTLPATGDLAVRAGKVVEVNRNKQVVWQYEAKPKEGYTGAVEIHSYQRLKNGLTMVAESGNARIVEVDKKGAIVKTLALTVENPNSHRDTRMARKLDNGH